MDKPLVSILMNCYNGEKFLKETLNSVIEQTYKNWELIFWDNQSTDKSAKIYKEYKDKRFKYYYSDKHTGLGEARSRAFKYLTGEFIAVLDADDIWLSEKLEKQIKMFEDREVGIVISNTNVFNSTGSVKLHTDNFNPSGHILNQLLASYFVSLDTLLIRKNDILKLEKNFDKKYDLIADFDLVVRLSKKVKVNYVPKVLSGWRIHESNKTFKDPKKFVQEKEIWLVEQKQNDFFLNNVKGMRIFENHLFRHKALFELIEFRRYESLKLTLNIKPKKLNDFILIIIIFLPFSSFFVSKILNKKMRFGL